MSHIAKITQLLGDNVKGIIVCLFCLVCSFSCTASPCNIEEARKHFNINVYLSESISIDAIELREMVSNEKGTFLPFGRLNSEWLTLKSKYRKGDCFVYFKTHPKSWKAFHGREGYLLIRQGEPISALTIKMN